MIAHKINDPHHSYCKCCDEDFEDDMGLFIHQLGSSNHSNPLSAPLLLQFQSDSHSLSVVCPVDALEFKSSAARDIHFEQVSFLPVHLAINPDHSTVPPSEADSQLRRV